MSSFAGFGVKTCKGACFKICLSLSCLVLIGTYPLVQSLQIHGQSDPFSLSNSCAKLPVSGITASGADALQPSSNAIDQNDNTRWSNLGLGSWIQIDLGGENVICSVGINWHRGDERVNSFMISLSSDGKVFSSIFSGKSDGSSLAEQNYNLQSKSGRFLRIIVTGNTQNNWVSISELKTYGYKQISESCVNSPVMEVTGPGQQSAFPPVNAIDDKLDSIWSNYGIGSSIELDLGIIKDICSIDVAWFKGDQRQNNFVISTSVDGKTYKTVLTAKSGGDSTSYERYLLPGSDKRIQFIKITVNGNTQNNYASISEINVKIPVGQPEIDCTDGLIQDVKTSGSQASFPGLNVLDGDLNTRWSNLGLNSWIQLDLGAIKNICSVDIAWHNGNERQNNFVISVSNDGANFANKLNIKSSGSTLDFEKYDLDDTHARYIRITVNGNTQNEWASITEISISTVVVSRSTFDIGAAGDWGSSGNDNWKKTVQLMIDNNVELALGLGDYSYGTINEFKPVVDSLKEAGITMKGAKGDHDSNSYAELFGQPSMVHAFDAGLARIIMLDAYKSPSSNAAFLEKELQSTTKPWKIVVTTTPLYTSPSNHGADEDQTDTLQPLLDKYGVDLVMWGDNHNYERIKFPNKHTVFVQSGTAGRSHYEFDGQIKESVYQNDNDYGFTMLMLDDRSLTGQFVAHSGKILDSFTLVK
ncbi:MAG TPA: discoidin domain-containing protein [Nitrososphaeraceae archaeon]|nr:discoidin domain-containing protein [Nitrososphaeraceae archaeon]